MIDDAQQYTYDCVIIIIIRYVLHSINTVIKDLNIFSGVNIYYE